MIEYCVEGVELPKISEELLSDWISRVASSHSRDLGELCYVFCSDDYILQVNNEHLNHDYYTDIITFDYSESSIISGDLFVSLDTVKSNSELFGQDYSNELMRVVIHGILHLCGINDKSDDEALQMRKAEEEALSLLKEMKSEF